MESFFKYIAGLVVSFCSLFAPIHSLILCAVVFVGVDFVTGVAASYRRAQRRGHSWGFESSKAWHTVVKLAFIMAGIVLSWLIDSFVLDFMELRLANLFTGFVCGVEMWSYLENAAEISQHPIFRWLQRFMKQKIDEQIGNEED